ncbi:MAG: thermonuclease family protein [Deltaproteobacteria bacterium]|nr:thermonuclease family protein [Deltaproteobacteria bacterium]
MIDVRAGDVLKISHPDKGGIPIILYGIDAPDKGQAHFKQAKKFLVGKVEGRDVNVQEFSTGQKIIAAQVFLDGENINEQVLQAGYAWVYEKYCGQDFCREWLNIEKQARNKKLGIWQEGNQIPPWEWRKKILTKIFRVFLWIVPPLGD